MEPILSVEQLTKRYKDFTLDHISFQIPRGMIVGMIGENGAGKTTTLMSVFQMISPDSGQIRLFGKNWRENRRENLQKVGLVMDGLNQNPRLYCKDLENIYKRIYSNFYIIATNKIDWQCCNKQLSVSRKFNGKQTGTVFKYITSHIRNLIRNC